MKYCCVRSGKIIECLASLGKGGEGEVFATSVDGMAAKIYHPRKRPDAEMIAKLQYMIDNTPEQPQSADNHIAITWPRDLLEHNGVVHGFLMDASSGEAIEKAVTPSSRKKWFPGQSWRHSLAMAHNLAWVVANIHAKGYVIGDVNEQNIRVRMGGVVSIIDIDSFQIHDPANGKIYPCTVMTPDFAAPELTVGMMEKGRRSANQDCFSLAIIVYRLLMCGNHPFNGVYQPAGDPPEQRTAIVKGFTVFDSGGPYKPRPKAPPLAILPPVLRPLFERTFIQGHRHPASRPTAVEWKNALWSILGAAGGIVDCTVNPVHAYSSHLPECPWCGLAAREQIEYYDPRVVAPKTRVNRPKRYIAAASHSPVPGMQVHVPVRPLPTMPSPQSQLRPATRQMPSQAPIPQLWSPAAPSFGGSASGGVRRGRGVGALGYGLRVVLALAMAVLFVWLNVSSLIWPYPLWDRFVRNATVLRFQVVDWVERGLREYGIELPKAVRTPQSVPWGGGRSAPSWSGGQRDMERLVPNAKGRSDSYHVPVR